MADNNNSGSSPSGNSGGAGDAQGSDAKPKPSSGSVHSDSKPKPTAGSVHKVVQGSMKKKENLSVRPPKD